MGQPGASSAHLIWINAAARLCVLHWVAEKRRISRLPERRSIMANTPVEVKKTAPAATNAPDAWRSLRTERDRMFDRFAGGWGMPSLRRMFDAEPALRYESTFTVPSPAVDITEDDGNYKVTAELPGMTEKEIEVVVSGDMLTLKGEKMEEKEQKEKNFYLSERSYGSFQRSFCVPEGVDRNKIAADFSKGVLTISMPKTAKAVEQQKKIEVKAAA
jgi:HSP20 family protein